MFRLNTTSVHLSKIITVVLALFVSLSIHLYGIELSLFGCALVLVGSGVRHSLRSWGRNVQFPNARRDLANDLLNLALISPKVKPHGRSDLDTGESMAIRNRYWSAERVVQVKPKCGLTVDSVKAAVLEHVLQRCESSRVQFTDKPTAFHSHAAVS